MLGGICPTLGIPTSKPNYRRMLHLQNQAFNAPAIVIVALATRAEKVPKIGRICVLRCRQPTVLHMESDVPRREPGSPSGTHTHIRVARTLQWSDRRVAEMPLPSRTERCGLADLTKSAACATRIPASVFDVASHFSP